MKHFGQTAIFFPPWSRSKTGQKHHLIRLQSVQRVQRSAFGRRLLVIESLQNQTASCWSAARIPPGFTVSFVVNGLRLPHPDPATRQSLVRCAGSRRNLRKALGLTVHGITDQAVQVLYGLLPPHAFHPDFLEVGPTDSPVPQVPRKRMIPGGHTDPLS